MLKKTTNFKKVHVCQKNAMIDPNTPSTFKPWGGVVGGGGARVRQWQPVRWRCSASTTRRGTTDGNITPTTIRHTFVFVAADDSRMYLDVGVLGEPTPGSVVVVRFLECVHDACIATPRRRLRDEVVSRVVRQFARTLR